MGKPALTWESAAPRQPDGRTHRRRSLLPAVQYSHPLGPSTTKSVAPLPQLALAASVVSEDAPTARDKIELVFHSAQ